MRRNCSVAVVVLFAIFGASCAKLDTTGRVELGQPQSGTLDPQHVSADYWFDAQVEGTYAIVFDSTTFVGDLTLGVYSDHQRTKLVTECDAYATSLCTVVLAPGRYYIRVHSVFAAASAGVYGITVPYTFELLGGGGEGTPDMPAVLDSPTAIHTISANGASYYTFDLADAGGIEVAIKPQSGSPTPQINVRIYAGGDFASVPLTGTCSYSGSTCRFFGVPSGPIGIRIDEVGGVPSVFQVSVTSTYSEGAPTDPVPLVLGVNDQNASVDGDYAAYSYYAITTGSSAGSLIFNAAGTTQSAALSVTVYSAYPDAVAGTCTVAYGSTSCAVGSLEANTRYIVAVRTGTTEASYTLTVSTGIAVGSQQSPVPVSLGVPVAGQFDLTTSSFYAFTPTETAYYVIDDGITNVDMVVRDSSGVALPTNAEYGLVAGSKYTIELNKAYSYSDTTYTLSVTKDPNGDGISGTPLSLVPGTMRTSTLRDTTPSPHYGRSYYSFTTDQDGDAYGIFVKADRNVYLSTSAIPGGTCTGYGTAIQTCTFTGLTANATFEFQVAASVGGDPRGVSVLVLDLDGVEPCEPGSLSCTDFSTNPSFANPGPANSAWTWVSATGNYSASGTNSPSCFDTTSPGGTVLMAFTSRVTSTNTADAVRVYLDPASTNTLAYTMTAATSGGLDKRRFFALAGAHTIRVCFEGTGSPRSAFLDNLAFR